jgi:hypothetical protein
LSADEDDDDRYWETTYDLTNCCADPLTEQPAPTPGVLHSVPRRFADWFDDIGAVLWWDTSMTGGKITGAPDMIGHPDESTWPYDEDDHQHLLWVPLPVLARNAP